MRHIANLHRRERDCVSLCACAREIVSLSLCVSERERLCVSLSPRARERLPLCVCVRERDTREIRLYGLGSRVEGLGYTLMRWWRTVRGLGFRV